MVIEIASLTTCKGMAANVYQKHAVQFAAIERCAEGRYQQIIFSRPKAHTNTRQKLLSEHN
jgi:hypothetical protein